MKPCVCIWPKVTEGGATFDFITGLSSPRGLCWDGDQTIYVADEALGARDFSQELRFHHGSLVGKTDAKQCVSQQS